MATLPSNSFSLADGSYTLGDGEDSIGSGTIGGADVFTGKANFPYGGYTAIGDTYVIYGTGKGGNDRFVGGANVGQAASGFDELVWGYGGGEDGGAFFYGDAQAMYDGATGGNDQATGGNNSHVEFYGDAYSMASATGGRDTFKGSNAITTGTSTVASSSLLVGDAWYGEDGRGEDGSSGGMDTMAGGNATSSGSGSTAGDASAISALLGDFYYGYEGTTGGNDSMAGGNASAKGGDAWAVNWLVGDSVDLYGTGGNDTIKGGGGTLSGGGSAFAANLITGDAMWMDGYASAGNDSLVGGSFADTATNHGDGYVANFITGDAWSADGYGGEDPVHMGDDRLTGGGTTTGNDGYVVNVMYGDVGDGYFADFFFDAFGGGVEEQPLNFIEFVPIGYGIDYGNDSLTGGSGRAENYMVGDAEYMGEDGVSETGGNDTITGGGAGSFNVMVGDGYYMGEDAAGGNDRLVSGAGEDMMIGDGFYMYGEDQGGADTFVFRFGNGNDWIEDFRVDDGDRIDISSMRTLIGSFARLEAQGRIAEDGDGNAVILLARSSPGMSNDTVTLYGISPEEVTAAFFNF